MSLSRQGLARIDRHLLSQLDHQEGVQLVKVPVSDAVWSTWRRYCDTVGIPMGRALALLLQQELGSLLDEDLDRAKGLLEQREADLSTREEAVADTERALVDRERQLAAKERQLDARASQSAAPRRPFPSPNRQGRNEPCTCGSGRKFKYCHGKG